MIRPDQISDKVVNALRASLADLILEHHARAAIAAAINAWPGATVRDGTAYQSGKPVMKLAQIILPLPQKDGDA